jgi:hypothetical protein
MPAQILWVVERKAEGESEWQLNEVSVVWVTKRYAQSRAEQKKIAYPHNEYRAMSYLRMPDDSAP